MEGDSNNRSRNGGKRPESMLAQNFAADLDAMFGLTPTINGLETEVNQKQASIYSGNSELRELEARLRATEERLAKVSRSSSPARAPPSSPPPLPPPPPTSVPRSEQQAMAGAHSSTIPSRTSPLAQRPTYPADRPPTAHNRPPIPGTRKDSDQLMPQIPGQFPSDMQQRNMSNDYIMVESQAQRTG